MEEIFPVSAGVVLGLVTHLVGTVRLKALLIALFGVAIGAFASWVSGELAISWVYVVIDTAQVVGASIMTAFLIGAWSRRQIRKMAR
jgi:ABC-type antimicrobial peptide transport system permease subunit